MTSYLSCRVLPTMGGPDTCTCRSAANDAIDALETAYSHTRGSTAALDDSAMTAAATPWHGQAATLMRQSLDSLIARNDAVRRRAQIMLTQCRQDRP
ncbi:hypothetical protein ACLUWG_05930 [Bifidobacterium apri]|uniref:hypothetical protein n=1 Tax=Bifidobacterium apri TaxID=1769423 RepID=UPI003995C355